MKYLEIDDDYEYDYENIEYDNDNDNDNDNSDFFGEKEEKEEKEEMKKKIEAEICLLRSKVNCIKLLLLKILINCFGQDSRDTGQSLDPTPPAIITGFIFITSPLSVI